MHDDNYDDFVKDGWPLWSIPLVIIYIIGMLWFLDWVLTSIISWLR